MNKEIKRIEYKDGNGNPQCAEVGKANIVSIVEHPAQGEGDKWYYDINFSNGDKFRIFDPIFVASKQE